MSIKEFDPFQGQCQRIREKLDQVRLSDPDFQVFGAASHKYQMGTPLALADLHEIETQCGIRFPADFGAFLTQVGHGAAQGGAAAAGPFYGITSLKPDLLLSAQGKALAYPAMIHPAMSNEDWSHLTQGDDDPHDDNYIQNQDSAYGGILYLGEQGCDFWHGLVLNGPFRGRVVYMGADIDAPVFTFEANFLDWYERWLDEILSGVLKQKRASWFGSTMGGDDAHLMSVFDATEDVDTKTQALQGLIKLVTVAPSTCEYLDKLCDHLDPDIRNAALRALTKFDLACARPHLERFLALDDESRRVACRAIVQLSEGETIFFGQHVLAHLSDIEDEDTFFAALWLLRSEGVDFTYEMHPLAKHPRAGFRKHVIAHLQGARNKQQCVDLLVDALEDPSPLVVHAALQALEGVEGDRLLDAYRTVAHRFPVEEFFIRENLKHRLRPYGYTTVEHFERARIAPLKMQFRKLAARLGWRKTET